jgi:hypothetical protein
VKFLGGVFGKIKKKLYRKKTIKIQQEGFEPKPSRKTSTHRAPPTILLILTLNN